jgi:TolB-like protein
MMKRVFLRNLISTVCLFTFLISPVFATTDFDKEIDQLSGNLAEKIATAGKKKIAVVDFTDLDGSVTELGRFLAEEFSTALAGTGKGFTVVDRIHLKTLLKEHNLSSTGLIDQNTIRQLGKIAGVDALVTGSLTPLGESVRINVKVLDIETAAVIEANRGNIAMTDAIKSLMVKGINLPASPGSGSIITPIKTRVETVQKVEEQNFVFEAIACKVSGKTVTFSFFITNKDKDRGIRIYLRNTSLYDEYGNEYKCTRGQIGIETPNWQDELESLIYSDVPTKAFLKFEEAQSQAKIAIAIVLRGRSEDKNIIIKFRGIPFSR